MQAIGCVSTVLCVTGNKSGSLITSTAPTGGLGGWKAFGGGGSVQITGVSCPSASECVATDDNGSVLTSTNPTAGSSAWSYVNLIRYELPQGGSFQEGNGLFGAACASRTLCAVTGARGQIFTSTDPFADPPAPTKAKAKKRGPERPRAKIATVKLPSNRAIEEHRAKVLVRFFARGRTGGFVCKFDKRPYRRCSSPKRYPVKYRQARLQGEGNRGDRAPWPGGFGRNPNHQALLVRRASVRGASQNLRLHGRQIAPILGCEALVLCCQARWQFARFKTDPLVAL